MRQPLKTKGKKTNAMRMTKTDFEAACMERLIDPRLAYETLADAIREGNNPDLSDAKAVLDWLDETF